MGVFIFKNSCGVKTAIRTEDISSIKESIAREGETEIHHINGIRMYRSCENHEELMNRWADIDNGFMQELDHPVLGKIFIKAPLDGQTLETLLRDV